MPRRTVHFFWPTPRVEDPPGKWSLSDYFDDDVSVTEDPDADYLIVLQFPRSLEDFARTSNPEQVRIYWAIEAVVPNFNVFDYAIGFDRLTLGDRYVRMHPLTSMRRYLSVEPILDGASPPLVHRPTRFCDYIYSNPGAHPMRTALFERLSSYQRVDSYGSHLNNTDESFVRTSWDTDWCRPKVPLHQEHRFSIAAENACHRGYTTEKLMTPLIAGIMPIYWGNPDVGSDFNAQRFVNVHDEASLDDVLARVIELDRDHDLMRHHLEQPVMTPEQVAEYDLAEERLRLFFRNIFSQEPGAARRRSEGPHQRLQEDAYFESLVGAQPPGPIGKSVPRRVREAARGLFVKK